MKLHLCPSCESGNHTTCWGTIASIPPGSYGGSKCTCHCRLEATAGVAIKTSIPPVIVMKAALGHAILVGACDGAIACLKAAIIHQQQAEAIADELIGNDDWKQP